MASVSGSRLPASSRRDWFTVIAAVARRPDLWATAGRQVLRLAPTNWWRTWPPLPLPADDYLRFRTVTQYGTPNRVPSGGDVITWLEWSRAWNTVAGSTGHRPENSTDQMLANR